MRGGTGAWYIPGIYSNMANDIAKLLTGATGFEWDAGNAPKVVARHRVEPGECEQAFFQEPFLVSYDASHSGAEPRWRALGQTAAGRLVFLVFTVRGSLIRVLAARDMSERSDVTMPKSRRGPNPSKQSIKPLRKTPAFKPEAAEREFWETADSTEYVDWSTAAVVRLPNLRPSSTAISVRLPDTLLTELKLLANERDVPYQSLLKVYLADRIKAERRRQHRRSAI